MIRWHALCAASMAIVLAVGSNSASAAPQCQMAQIADLPVRVERNHLLVDGAINGRKVGILIDTGAGVSLILRAAAMRLGLNRQEVRRYRMLGVGGETHVEMAYLAEFKIGEAARKGWRVIVAGERDLGENIAFVLGEDFFQQIDVEFDLAHGAIRLFQPRDCGGVSLAYWSTAEASEVAIDKVDDAHPQIVLTVQVNGQPLKALLDSGATSSVLATPDAARLGVTPQTPGVVALGRGGGLGQNPVDIWLGPFDSFTIGDETITNTTIPFADVWRDATLSSTGSRIGTQLVLQQPMLLGVDFLRAHRLLIAHSQQKIYFSYAGGPVFQRTAAVDGDGRPSKAIGASCQYSSECLGDVGCVSGQCQRAANTADQCLSHTECSIGEWCIGSPRRCQAHFNEGMACSKDADCAGSLRCIRDLCARLN